MKEYLFRSERLGFRQWIKSDLEPFARMNADPAVMKFFPKTLSLDETRGFIERLQEGFKQNGFGAYAVDTLENNAFIGLIGFMKASFEAHFTPCIEIAWRIKKQQWGKGYATEGAARCLEYGFSTLHLTEVYSFTATLNKPSEKVMQKIGMVKQGEFIHPRVPREHPLSAHVLYKITGIKNH